MEKTTKPEMGKSFGVFSPTGHVVIVFSGDAEAKMARNALIAGGFRSDSIVRLNKDEVLSQTQESEKTDIKILQLGQEMEKVQRFAEFAKQGCGFLVVSAPGEEDSKHAIDLVHAFKPIFAEKYNRLTIQELA